MRLPHFHITAQISAALVFLSGLTSGVAATHEVAASFHSPPGGASQAALVRDQYGNFWGTTIGGGDSFHGTVYKLNKDTGELITVVSFTGNGTTNKGSGPEAGLVPDGKGWLWGTTCKGGALDQGTVFKVNIDTGMLTTMAEFSGNGATNKGATPRGNLLADGAGFFWGTTSDGGASGYGTVFKLNENTGELTTILEFTGTEGPNKGALPYSGLVSDGAGYFWGTTSYGGIFYGTVFKVNSNTGELTTVVEFTNDQFEGDGGEPRGSLASDGEGYFWGTTQLGIGNSGTIFKVKITTGELTTVVNIGNYPYGDLAYDGAGSFWGTTIYGGSNNGTVYKVNVSSGELTTVAEFTNAVPPNKGAYPYAGLTNDGAGSLWGTTRQGGPANGGTVYKVNMSSGELTTVSEFNDSSPTQKGRWPKSGLVNDELGSLWGTTSEGGASGYGTVFKMNISTGALTTVVEFTNDGPVDKGAYPQTGLTSAGAGSLWGTTPEGGAMGYGTVYKVDVNTGELTTVVEFTGNGPTDKGSFPRASLVADGAGSFWGSTFQGGAANLGTIYKVNASTGVLTTVVEFTGDGPNNGSFPHATLTSDGAGSLWGTSWGGTIFKVSMGTGELTTVFQFTDSAANGRLPVAGHASDGMGSFWGTTSSGGAVGSGTVFKVNVNTGGLTTLVHFSGLGGQNRGFSPLATLVSDGGDTFWGTTCRGGASDSGTVFKVNKNTGMLTTMVEFTGDGPQPHSGTYPGYGSLLKGADGNFYGTTMFGGPGRAGTVFRIRFGPTPVTESIASITAYSALLQGSLNPNGLNTAASFEWGTDPTLALSTVISAGTTTAGNNPEPVSVVLNGLTPNTTYYFRVVGANSENAIPQRGQILSFKTRDTAPEITLIGDSTLIIEASDSYTDPGATATDQNGNPLPTEIASNFVLSKVPGTYSVTWTATDQMGESAWKTRVVIVQDTTAPVIGGNFSPLRIRAGLPLPDYRAQATVNDLVGVTSVIQSPQPGTVTVVGPVEVTITAQDAANNENSTSFTVNVTPVNFVASVLVTKGGAVPNAGNDARIPSAAVWSSFGSPAINDVGNLAFLGKWNSPSQASACIFVDDTLVVKAGEAVPGAGANGLPADAIFKSFREPVLDAAGHVTLLATIKGAGVRSSNDTVVVSNRNNGALEVLAREGDMAPGTGGAIFKGFYNVSAQGSGGTLFTGRLVRRTGNPRVTGANDTGAWWLPATESTVLKLAREGDSGFQTGEKIKSILALETLSGSPGHGRGLIGDDQALLALRLSGGPAPRQALVLAEPGTLRELAATGDVLGGAILPGAVWKTMNLPSSSNDGSNIATMGSLSADIGGVTDTTAKGIFVSADGGSTWDTLVRIGDIVPDFDDSVIFTGFRDPVNSSTERGVAFLATIKGPGVRRSNNDTLWWKVGGGQLRLVAREGDEPASGPSGAKWKSFTSLALPGGGAGPIFTAALGPGAGGVTSANDCGLYAIDNDGTLHELIRENQPLDDKVVKTFTVLKAVGGSLGVARSFNANYEIVARVTFTDGGSAIVKVEVP